MLIVFSIFILSWVLAWIKSFWRGSKFFWRESNCIKSKFEADRIFCSCLQSNLKVDYSKIAKKLEVLSQNRRKIKKTLIKQKEFCAYVFLENKQSLY